MSGRWTLISVIAWLSFVLANLNVVLQISDIWLCGISAGIMIIQNFVLFSQYFLSRLT